MPPKTPSRLLALTLAVAFLAASGLATAARADIVDRVVLRVNDRIATLLDYQERRADMMAQLAASDLPPERRDEILSNLGSRLFRDMLEELLLLSRADQLRIQPTEEEVDRGVRGVRENLGISSDDELASALASQGMSLAEFREQVRDQLRMRGVIGREVTSEIKVEEDDLRRAYRAAEDDFRLPERFRVREMIVLEDDHRDPDEVRALASSIHAALEEGQAFEDLAAEHAKTGETSDLVDLGWITKGELDPDLEAAIASLAPGEYSQPVEGRGGLHILQLMEHEDSRLQAFGEVADQIRARERQRLYNEKMATYMRDLEQSAYVRAEPPADAAGFRTVAGSHDDEEDPFAGFEPVGGEPDVTPPTDRPEPEGAQPPPGG